jgi:hypothetical protein
MDAPDDGPVMVHMTACREHLRANRRWLRTRQHPDDDVITLRTEVLMREWDQIVEPMTCPVVAPVAARRSA